MLSSFERLFPQKYVGEGAIFPPLFKSSVYKTLDLSSYKFGVAYVEFDGQASMVYFLQLSESIFLLEFFFPCGASSASVSTPLVLTMPKFYYGSRLENFLFATLFRSATFACFPLSRVFVF